MTPSASVDYELDGDDFITAVSPGWDRFALDNGGTHATAAHVIGTLLWRHITDENLRHLLRVLFGRARGSRKPVVVHYNCNSPDTRRHMHLVLQSPDGRKLSVRSVVESESPLVTHGDAAAGRGSLRMCSWCNRFDDDGTWRDFEDMLTAWQLLKRHQAPDISHTICGDCARTLEIADVE